MPKATGIIPLVAIQADEHRTVALEAFDFEDRGESPLLAIRDSSGRASFHFADAHEARAFFRRALEACDRWD